MYSTPQDGCWEVKEESSREYQNRGSQTHNPEMVVPTQPPSSPLDDISNLLGHLPLQACVELTRRLLTYISFLPTGATRPRAVLKTVILFVAEYGSTP
jgi:hypothetical protein